MPKAKVNGINLNFNVEGNGEPLILIMGFAGVRNAWVFQTRAFKKHFRVITFDNRGVGKTDKPDGPYTIKMMADDTIGLMDHLAIDKAHILGISMGGMIAQEIAINYPDRVKKLVLGCTSASSETAPEVIRVVETISLGGVNAWKGLAMLCQSAINNRLLRVAQLQMFWMHTLSGGTKGLAGQAEAVRHHNTLDRLHMIGIPTLVIAGTLDRIIPPNSSDVIADLIPDARLVKIEDGSHVFFVDQRDRFNQEVIEFLQ